MKKSILSLLVLAFVAMTSNVMAQEIREGAVIEFEKDVHDYGDVAYKGNGTYSFVFTNTGSEPLMISNAKGSCGCTVPSWPKEPIAPGASSKIDVTYDTKRVGAISKSVTLTSNAVNTPMKVLRIKGTVLPQEQVSEPAPPALEAAVKDAVEEVEVVEEQIVLTKKQMKAAKKAEKKRLRKMKKEAKRASKKKTLEARKAKV
ncbi:MAG: DUF1573 domain-containing protein [Crocinitomicaceae bacterium]